jgi:hypothetical protein
MNSAPRLAKDWATVGKDIYLASSAEEKEVANCVLNNLFEGDAEGKDGFMERFFGNKLLTEQCQHRRTAENWK